MGILGVRNRVYYVELVEKIKSEKHGGYKQQSR
jgi:hypothetical protein